MGIAKQIKPYSPQVFLEATSVLLALTQNHKNMQQVATYF